MYRYITDVPQYTRHKIQVEKHTLSISLQSCNKFTAVILDSVIYLIVLPFSEQKILHHQKVLLHKILMVNSYVHQKNLSKNTMSKVFSKSVTNL